MEIARWNHRSKRSASSKPAARRSRAGTIVSSTFFALGALFLLAALSYAGYAGLNTWLMGQNRYLVSHDIAPLLVPDMTPTPSPTPTPTPLPTFTSTPTPIPTPTPTPTPVPPPRPVQIRIPVLGITRSIISLPRTRDRATGAWTWDTNRLFRAGRTDLVGHWDGTSRPGEEGNMVLVGHNYGYGFNGVFVRLGQLRPGHLIYVVNQMGQTFTYRVRTVNRVKWRTQSFQELTQHLTLLSPGGVERVTLVSCAGADVEPFPERIYVVADPVGP
ncbi:MAG: class F sortase [Anaerolineae bacterium]